MSPDLITVSQEQVVLQNPCPSAGPSLIPTASPQQRVNSAMEGMIGVPAQAVFHSRVAQVHARSGSHGALIPKPASADEYKGKHKSTCSYCGHFKQLDFKRNVPKSLCVPVEKMMWMCSCDVCSSAARDIGLNPPSPMRRLSRSRLFKRRRKSESQPSADIASDSGSVEAPLNEVLGGGRRRRDQIARSSASPAPTPPPAARKSPTAQEQGHSTI